MMKDRDTMSSIVVSTDISQASEVVALCFMEFI